LARAERVAPAGARAADDPVPLIRSKLQPPALPRETVPRPRLLDELRAGSRHALTLVCAPAGYGKTTLLSQWVHADADAAGFAWVTLDEGDADPILFWTYLVSALSAIASPAGQRSLPALSRHPERLTAEALPRLLEELEEASHNLVLVVEDYHLAECPPVTESLAFFLERRPQRLQVVLSARSDPRLPLGRWRANGQPNSRACSTGSSTWACKWSASAPQPRTPPAWMSLPAKRSGK
jgi:LuxR family transcriptional regulator, maltose regulon positive regulatory protein